MNNARAARIMILFWLGGWYLKAWFYTPYLLETTQKYPIVYSFFPPFFLNPDVAAVIYFLPLISGMIGFFGKGRYLNFAAISFLVSSVLLNLHINTCNDATFVTSFWTSLWLVWFTRHLNDTSAEFYSQAKVLAQCVVGLIFLGGFIGKLTPEYWSGEVVLRIFNDHGSPFGQLMAFLSTPDRLPVAAGVSKILICAELFLALAPLFSYRFFVSMTAPIFVVVSLFSTWTIFSVLLCLAGILVAGLLLEKSERVPA